MNYSNLQSKEFYWEGDKFIISSSIFMNQWINESIDPYFIKQNIGQTWTFRCLAKEDFQGRRKIHNPTVSPCDVPVLCLKQRGEADSCVINSTLTSRHGLLRITFPPLSAFMYRKGKPIRSIYCRQKELYLQQGELVPVNACNLNSVN